MTDESNGNVKISVSLDRDVYEQIERISTKLGIEPSTWINIIATSKLEDMRTTARGRDHEVADGQD